ncbi:hypothetical protein HMPREF1556_01377 [Porphyromonas sp. oral taxon 278 str. W7784]|nr:hypothetical protein HMPREF1556_01377 [Porphyromonas sp. oral taxon 278 str. W7784]
MLSLREPEYNGSLAPENKISTEFLRRRHLASIPHTPSLVRTST